MIKQVFLFFTGIIAGGFIFYMLFNIKTEDKSYAILKVLQSNCKCDQINQFLYVKGLSISKDGTSTETAEYELKNCKYSTVSNEVVRINNLLINKVEGYTDFDRFTLEFVNQHSVKSITINNGKINN